MAVDADAAVAAIDKAAQQDGKDTSAWARALLVAKAKKEGAVKVLSGLDPSSYPSMMESFKKKYPFLKIDMSEITGPDSAQRFIMELKSGSRNDFDTAHASTEFYQEYLPFAKKFDLLGMAESGVLRIPPKMIDPKHRAIPALGRLGFAPAPGENELAGQLRGDLTHEDLALVTWANSRVLQAVGAAGAPDAWRRHLGFLLDGFRADRATPLPEAPLSPRQVYRAMLVLGRRSAGITGQYQR